MGRWCWLDGWWFGRRKWRRFGWSLGRERGNDGGRFGWCERRRFGWSLGRERGRIAGASGGGAGAGSGGTPGGSGGGAGCEGQLSVVCDGVCVDSSTDAQHCGACGHACPSRQPCVNGMCSKPSCEGTVGFEQTFYELAETLTLAPLDLHTDGLVDLAVVSRASVTFLVNQGSGSFAAGSSFSDGSEAFTSAAASDLNGDGLHDLAIGSYDTGNALVLLSRGDGTFTDPTKIDLLIPPSVIVLEDMNADMVPDLLAHGNSLSLFINRGDGSFEDYRGYNTGTAAGNVPSTSMAIADFDRNGARDLATLDSHNGRIGIMLAQAGDFPTSTYYTVGNWPGIIAARDIDDDDDDDLLVANLDDREVVLLENDTGALRATSTWETGAGPTALAFADWEGDGVEDMAIANAFDGSVSIVFDYASDPAPRTFITGGAPYDARVADFDQDGSPDLAVALGAALNDVSGVLILLSRCPI